MCFSPEEVGFLVVEKCRVCLALHVIRTAILAKDTNHVHTYMNLVQLSKTGKHTRDKVVFILLSFISLKMYFMLKFYNAIRHVTLSSANEL